MLIGQAINKIDDKNRLVIPQSMREELGEEFYISNGLDGCLFVMSVEEFTIFRNKIREQPMSKVRKLQRYFFGDATRVKPDKQGRVLLTPTLMELAALQRDVVIIGADNRLELWDKSRWDKWNNINADEMSENIANLMEEIGV